MSNLDRETVAFTRGELEIVKEALDKHKHGLRAKDTSNIHKLGADNNRKSHKQLSHAQTAQRKLTEAIRNLDPVFSTDKVTILSAAYRFHTIFCAFGWQWHLKRDGKYGMYNPNVKDIEDEIRDQVKTLEENPTWDYTSCGRISSHKVFDGEVYQIEIGLDIAKIYDQRYADQDTITDL